MISLAIIALLWIGRQCVPFLLIGTSGRLRRRVEGVLSK